MSEELIAIMGDRAYATLLELINDRSRRGTPLAHPVFRRRD